MADETAAARLIFVYNVDASPLALLRDLYQQVTTGSTDCQLCDLTFGTLLKDPQWSKFVAELGIPAEFRLRSTFLRHHPDRSEHRFPAVFVADVSGNTRELISADELNAVDDLTALTALVGRRVEELHREQSPASAPAERPAPA